MKQTLKILPAIAAACLLTACSTLTRLGVGEDLVVAAVDAALARQGLAGAVSPAQTAEIITIIKAETRLQEIGEEIGQDERITQRIEELLAKYLRDGQIVEPSIDEVDAANSGDITPDEIDLSSVKWHGPDVRGWAIASALSACHTSGDMLHFPHSKAGKWPEKNGVEGNVWVVAKLADGHWHAASWEWLRPGQTSKPWAKMESGHIKQGDFAGYQFKRGEEAYLIVTALARGTARSVAERSAARKIEWR